MHIPYRYLILLCCLSIVVPVSAQKMSVKSFSLMESSISANIQGPDRKIDQNGEVAALIKVRTTETGFRFDGGLMGIVDTKQDVGEIYVWVPWGAKKIQIKHQKFGVLDYWYSVPVESGRTYLLELKTDYVPDADAPTEQYFVLNVSPANAEVIIDDNPVEVVDGVAMVRLKCGEHNFTVQAAMHRSEAGVVDITDKKETMNIRLAPDYGVLQVSSTPSGAEVYLDGDYQSVGTTPFTTRWLAPGKHSLQFRYPSYKSYTADVQVTGDGTTQPFTATLQPNFADVTITAPGEAEIYVNDERKGTGTWNGHLNAGLYTIEARKASHHTAMQSVEVVAGDTKTINLPAPIPRYGSLDVSSRPVGATVSVDGKEIGETPDIFSEVLIGTHIIRLTKAGCAPMEQQVTIEEGKTATLSLTLATSGKVTITSNVAGAKIYIDDEYKGVAPYTYEAVSGSYRVTAKADGYTDATRTVTITAGQNTNLALAPQPISRNRTFTVKGVSFTMVPVEGGTFTMGATSEQGSDAQSDEKPTHSVTLDSYYIGETEVTQALWKAVMGDNPSYFKGDLQRPVENVSWNDCQKFIRKLNKLTGQNFRLPTEAEWEYAARGGNKSKGYKYAGSNTIGDVAWYTINSGSTTHPIKTKQANELGLYDMSGNVYEWCSDWYGSYSSSAQTNPTGPVTGSYRVDRGGGWIYFAWDCRVSDRPRDTPDFRDCSLGLRLAVGSLQ